MFRGTPILYGEGSRFKWPKIYIHGHDANGARALWKKDGDVFL